MLPLESGTNRACIMLFRRGLLSIEVDSVDAARDDSGVISSGRGDDPIGDEETEEPTSTVSTCAANPLDVESNDCVEPGLCSWRYLFTSILLLKYASRHSSKVTVFPSVGSGIATSSNLSLMNL